jgi:TPR repeat protein
MMRTRYCFPRCAQTLFRTGDFTGNAVEKFAEPAARAGDKGAQFCLGLWFAKMDETGKHLAGILPAVNYRKAIKWLTLAGRQGSADAWYVISRIYLKAEFTNRSIADAECYMEYAAEAGHCGAQLELGKRMWRRRRNEKLNDARAARWLQRARDQGSTEADQLLKKIAMPATAAPWAYAAQCRLLPSTDLLLASRIRLAACFGLSEREALLLDLDAADHGHCLVVDIRAQHVRSKRRLILIQTGYERQTLDQIKHFFEQMDSGVNGPEGNYRQRRYRLETALSAKNFATSS